MKRYDTYKDSGVEWLGEIPKHWEIKELKHLSSSQPYSFVDGPFGSDLKNKEYVDEGIPLIQLNNIGIGEHLLKNKRFITSEKSEQLSKHRAFPGEIVIAKMAEPVARAAKVSEDFSQYNIVADCIKFKPDDKLIESDLLVAIINSEYVRTQAELKATGTTRLRISLDTAKRLKVAIPPYEEQVSLSKYIKEKTCGIDKIIRQKEFLLEKLQAKRQAIINEAVTKGLNSNVPMKPSGVEWLGDIPEHWEVKRLKYVLDFFNHKRIPLSGEERGGMENKLYDYYGASGIIDKVEGYLYDGEYILVGEDGANLLSRSSPLAFKASGKFWVNNHAHILKPKVGNLDYYENLLESFDYTIYVTGSAQPKLTIHNLANIELPTPPIEEQKEISYYIRQIGDRIKQIEILLSKQINKLNQYRQSLISEVVTGKIKVV